MQLTPYLMSISLAVCTVSYAEEEAAAQPAPQIAEEKAPSVLDTLKKGIDLFKKSIESLSTVKDEATANTAAANLDKLTAFTKVLKAESKKATALTEEEMPIYSEMMQNIQADATILLGEITRITEAKLTTEKLDQSIADFFKALGLGEAVMTSED